jgi:hypothetical protein
MPDKAGMETAIFIQGVLGVMEDGNLREPVRRQRSYQIYRYPNIAHIECHTTYS